MAVEERLGRLARLADAPAFGLPRLSIIEIPGPGGDGRHFRILVQDAARNLEETVKHDVVVVSGLGEVIDVPIRGYSAGMSLRLVFALATAMTPDILLMDEWFLAGDADFMMRAEERLARLVRDAEILVLATHDMNIIRKWCTRVIRLEGGRIVADGSVEEVLGPSV